jgi:hypothetical protein
MAVRLSALRAGSALLPHKHFILLLVLIPPLWSSGQSSWLQIRRPGLEKKVMGLERGPLSLVSTTEELLDRKVAAPV